MRKLASVVAALAAAGCTLWDGRPEVVIEPAELPVVAETLFLRVVSAKGSDAQLLLDGEARGEPVPVGQNAALDLRGVAPGVHRVKARLRGLPYAVESAESTFVVGTPPVPFDVSPPPGPHAGPLVVTLTPRDAFAAQGTVAFSYSTQGVASAARGGDGVWTITLQQPLDALPNQRFQLGVTVTDAYGNRREQGAIGWSKPFIQTPSLSIARVGVGATGSSVIGGVVTLSGDFALGAVLPAELEVLAGTISLGTAAVIGGHFELTFDTHVLAEGSHALSFHAPGFFAAAGPTVTIDNTPPVVTCVTELGPQGFLPARGRVSLQFSEPVTVAVPPVFESGGATIPSVELRETLFGRVLGYCPALPVVAPAQAALVVPAGAIRDAALNAAPEVRCVHEVPLWYPPAGPAPFVEAGATISAADAVIRVSGAVRRECQPPLVAGAVYRGAPGTAREGQVWSSGQQVNAALPASALEVADTREQLLVFVSSGQPYSWNPLGPAPLPIDLGGSAGVRAVVPWTLPGTPLVVAWVDSDGHALRSSGGGLLVTYASDPAATYDELAVLGSTVAFTERRGGPALLRVLDSTNGAPRSPFSPDVLNADPTVDASGPALAQVGGLAGAFVHLVWVEAGTLYTRQVASEIGSTWGPPTPLRVDVARPAWLPRLREGLAGTMWLAHVQETDGGEEIRLWRWDGSWTLMPGAANAGVPGTVATLDLRADGDPVVTWTDAVGQVFTRVYAP